MESKERLNNQENVSNQNSENQKSTEQNTSTNNQILSGDIQDATQQEANNFQTEITEEKREEELSEMERLQKENDNLNEEVIQWKDKFLRKMAEFENYKKRVAQDQVELIKYSNEKLIKDLLPIIDDFERALNFSKEELKNNSILQGVEMVYSKLMKILASYGLKKIEALNQPFDFNCHEALLQVPKNDVKPLTVLEEVEKGYMLNDKVIRHSKVIVSSDTDFVSNSNENHNGEGK